MPHNHGTRLVMSASFRMGPDHPSRLPPGPRALLDAAIGIVAYALLLWAVACEVLR